MVKNKRYYPLPLRAVALVLTVLLLWSGLLLTALGCVGLMAGADGAMAPERIAERYLNRDIEPLAQTYFKDGTVGELPSLYAYTITAADGAEIVSTYDGGEYLAAVTRRIHDGDKRNRRWLTVTLYCPPAAELTGDSPIEKTVRMVQMAEHGCAWLLGGGILCVVLTVCGAAFLCCAAGRRREGDPTATGLSRIPFDVFTVLWAGAAALPIALLRRLPFGHNLVYLAAWVVTAVWLTALLMSYLLSVAVRVKTRTLWRNTLVARLWWALRGAMVAAGRHLPLVWQVLTVAAVLSLAELAALIYFRDHTTTVLVLWAAEKLVLIPLVLWLALGLARLQGGIRRIADGEVTHQVSTNGLAGALKASAEDINRAGDGLQSAVEQQLKSERMKTELITNVSHDLKTPLTSIINYVDLMEKEDPQDPTLQEYLAVLSRQSVRLKKLVDDLLEASKASTGNLKVEMAPCCLSVLLEQVVGEYSERARAANVALLLQTPPQEVTALADGRHLWRVLDNLLSNVCKYVQPHTRAYLDLTVEGAWAHIVLRNVSREPLHITPDELMERFVRGDSARHTEGSGLGLAIARSLMELQGGTLTLTVDGDLFKVDLALPITEQ